MAFGVSWAGRRKLRDGFCGYRGGGGGGGLKLNAHLLACLAGSGAGSDSAYLCMYGQLRL